MTSNTPEVSNFHMFKIIFFLLLSFSFIVWRHLWGVKKQIKNIHWWGMEKTTLHTTVTLLTAWAICPDEMKFNFFAFLSQFDFKRQIHFSLWRQGLDLSLTCEQDPNTFELLHLRQDLSTDPEAPEEGAEAFYVQFGQYIYIHRVYRVYTEFEN